MQPRRNETQWRSTLTARTRRLLLARPAFGLQRLECCVLFWLMFGRFLAIILPWILAISALFGQEIYPGQVDFSFDAGAAPLQRTYRLVTASPDNGVIALDRRVGKLHKFGSDGREEKRFAFVSPTPVIAAITNRSGKLLVSVGKETAISLSSLNIDGTPDAAFSPIVFPNSVGEWALSLEANENILMAGRFHFDQQERWLVRVTKTGEIDAAFNPSIAGDPSSIPGIFTIAVEPTGGIVIAGDFLQVNGAPRHHIARLHPNGTLDENFNPGSGFTSSEILRFSQILPVSNGSMYVLGNFSAIEGQSRSGFARLRADGSLDAFDPPLPGPDSMNPQGIVSAAALDSEENLFVAGSFCGVLSPNGNKLASFKPLWAYSVIIQTDNRFVLDTAYVGTHGLVRLGQTGITETEFDPAGPADRRPSEKIGLLSDGGLLLSGAFSEAAGKPVDGLAKLRPDGSLDRSFSSTGLSLVHSFASDHLGRIVLGGRAWAGLSVVRADVNGVLDPSFQGPTFTDYYDIFSISVADGGEVFLGGYFKLENNIRRDLVRLSPDGSVDTSWNSSITNNLFFAVLPNKDGTVYVGGALRINDSPRSVLRLKGDGGLDRSFVPPSFWSRDWLTQGDVPAVIYALAVDPRGRLLVSGNFYKVDSRTVSRVARLLPGGELDISFNPEIFEPDLLAIPGNGFLLQPDGKIIVANGIEIVRLLEDGSRDQWFPTAVASVDPLLQGNPRIYSLALDQQGQIYVSGEFDFINGVECPNVARLWGDQAVIAPALTWESGPMIRIRGRGSSRLRVETSSNLFAWNTHAEITNFTGVAEVPVPAASTPSRFFRAILLPPTK